jgi:NADH dehydrogenase FAD-containing subunit
LCICSGSKYETPIKEANLVVATRGNHLRNYYSKLCKSEKILIIGGGLVGVELASEIITHYPNKEITIVHSKDKLIERNHDNAIVYADKFLRKQGVKIIFGQRMTESKGNYFLTDGGKKIKADLAFLCTGIKPNFDFMNYQFSDKLNENNQIKVNNHLQVEGFRNIFAAGDVNDRLVEKTAQNSRHQGKIVAKNIISLEKNIRLKEYSSKTTPLVISLGKWDGIFSWKNFVFTGIIPGIMKSVIEWMRMLSYR